MQIEAFFDESTCTLTYVVWDRRTRDAVIIDPVLDYDPLASQTSSVAVQALVDVVRARSLNVHWILETHAHADHMTGAQLLKRELGAKTAIGERITVVQSTFKQLFDLPDAFATDGRQFDRLLADGERFAAGSLSIEVISTPGHTPACVSYLIGDAVFTGDALFMDDYGTGRTDFPKGSAEDLYRSVHDRLYSLPDATRVFVGHDYQPDGREVRWETTIGRSKQFNPQLRAETSQRQFVEFRKNRDAELRAPRLIYQSIQVNVNGGTLPAPHQNGIRYFNLPLNLRVPTDDVGCEMETPRAAE